MNNNEIAAKIVVGTISAVVGLAFLKAGVKTVIDGAEALTKKLAENVKGA